ncbi:Rid family hydrolase, partial [Escherichia coli]|uniref:Rid family hydrolase n=1 Tax=Escherichia coli TaxID=562 RepID=UPI003EDFDB7E
FDDIIDVTSFHTDPEKQFEDIMTVKNEIFSAPPYPTWTAVGVARDLFTIDGSAPELMRKKILRHGKKVGFINLIKDGMKGVTVL